MLRLLVGISILFMALMPSGSVKALPSSNLTISYVSDYEVYLNWTKGSGVVNTMVRGAYGRSPTDRNDGFQIYYGAATNCTNWVSNIGTLGVIYYRLWTEDALGNWSDYDSGEGSFMSISFLFISLLILALTLTLASFRWKDLLLSWSAFLVWLAMGFWWILGGLDNFSIEDSWIRILIFVPFLMAFVVMLQLMNFEKKVEEGSTSWTEYGERPRKFTSNYELYKKELRRRTRG